MAIPKGVTRRVQVQLTTTALAAYTGAAPTVMLTKDGGAQAAATNAATHKGGGQWELALTATEMTADEVTAQFSAAGVVPVAVTLYPEGDVTPARAAKLDNLDALVSSRSTYAGGDTAGTTTLLARVPGVVPVAADYSAARAARLDYLDAPVSSRSTVTTATINPPARRQITPV